MEERKMKILDPTVENPPGDGALAPRLNSFDGKVIGFLDNKFHGADKTLMRAEEILKSRYNLAGTVVRHKSYLGEPAADEIMDEMLSSCDAVITAIGA